MQDLFESKVPNPETRSDAPLAVRMRPQHLDEVAGQSHLLAKGKLLKRTIETGRWTSMIFYGPPGSGKTTLARLISRLTQSHFVPLNAVTSNAAQLRKQIAQAKKAYSLDQKKTILFIDEIHRFNKAQQDVLMPDVEEGNPILLGATTQNPSFAINGPLLSRSTIFELRALSENELVTILKRALEDQTRGYGKLEVKIESSALEHIAKSSGGDARRALNALEVGVLTTSEDKEGVIHFSKQVAEESCQKKIVHYDQAGDYHYDTISAFIKSLRGSDVDAAVYWLAKMLHAGEDPRFIVRRLLILASEDIGNADPNALILAASGMQAVEFVGLPEARIILSQLVTYLALAPKSNASYMAIEAATKEVMSNTVEEVPNHLRSAPYPGAKKMGHGDGYVYSHDAPKGHIQKFTNQAFQFYHPKQSGFEKTLAERLQRQQKS